MFQGLENDNKKRRNIYLSMKKIYNNIKVSLKNTTILNKKGLN